MRQFLQQLVNGSVLGALYALIALGYTMVYGIIQLINFAHGEIFMLGGFGGLTVYKYVLPDTIKDQTILALPLMLVGGIVVAVVVALLVERFAYRPLRHAPRLAPLITAIGVSIFLQEAVRLYYPDGTRNQPFPRMISTEIIDIGGVEIQVIQLVTVMMTIALTVALQGFIKTSRTGKAMRATAQDPDTARLMGVNTDRIIVITFAIGAGLAAIGGMTQGLLLGGIEFKMGFIAGIKAFTAAVIGGIGNITGAVLGGFLLGIVEALATQYGPGGSGYKDVWAFVVLIVILVFRPSGLLGERVGGRA